MSTDITVFRQIFAAEAQEHLSALEQGLLNLENNPEDKETLNEVFRAAHSIKGGAGTVGFTEIAIFTHDLETVLDAMREGRASLTRERVSLFLKVTDELRSLVESSLAGSPQVPQSEALHTLVSEINRGEAQGQDLTTSAKGNPETPRELRLKLRPTHQFFSFGLDPLLLFHDLADLGTVRATICNMERVPQLAELDPEKCYLGWDIELSTTANDDTLHGVFAFVEDECPLTIETLTGFPAASSLPSSSQATHNPEIARGVTTTPNHNAGQLATLRVGSDKVDAIIDLVGELVIAQSVVMQLISSSALPKTPVLEDAMQSMTRNMQELQERVMGIRMVPMGSLFGRFTRIVRDTAMSLGKNVNLVLEGEDTEIDKAVAEKLSDPLVHLVRNAIDHGLEPDEERQAVGKTEPATLRLTSRQVAGGLVIEIADNGRGLNLEKIRQKAEHQGLIQPGENVTEEQLQSLIFEPGFSTAATVSDLSGRGVGMDVVRRCVDGLNGTIAILSQPHAGTTFRIKLPVTLAILDGLLLRLGEQIYILPLLAVTESFRPRPEDVKSVVGGSKVAMLRGTSLPLIDLGVIFGLTTEARDVTRTVTIVVEADGHRIGLVVDALVGQSQVVVKSVEAHYHKVEGILGATILGTGQVAFIVDIAGLVRLAWGHREGDIAVRAA